MEGFGRKGVVPRVLRHLSRRHARTGGSPAKQESPRSEVDLTGLLFTARMSHELFSARRDTRDISL